MLARSEISAREAIEHLVGMQAQVPTHPYIGLWTRLDGFHTDDLAKLITQRRAVRMDLMRGTVHRGTCADEVGCVGNETRRALAPVMV